MEENETPETEEKKLSDELEDLAPEKDPIGGGTLTPNAQKREEA